MICADNAATTKMSVEKCKHEYVFDANTLLTSYPPQIKGVCKLCGKNITLDEKEY
jgi:hypothetical protein